MKRFMLVATMLFFVLCASAFAADKAAPGTTTIAPGKPAPAQIAPSKIVRMRATGVVVEISNTMIKINRTVKDNVEFMEFALENPLPSIKIGDYVNVSYITKNGGNTALRVYPVKKYTIKPAKATEAKDVKKTSETALPVKEKK
jgi:hypothetical protein